MLRRLLISNYAIISHIEVEFSNGLNIITGETGAGKSILIGALGLILGNRADSSVLPDKDKKCIVEGYFDVDEKIGIRQFLEENELDTEVELTLRREILSSGKSRAFINDSPVSVAQLQKLASLLVDLHQQFDTIELGQNQFQLNLLDAISSQLSQKSAYTSLFTRYQAAKKQSEILIKQKEEAVKEFDYHQFLYNELADASIKAGDLEEWETELDLLTHAEQVKTVLFGATELLTGAEQPICQQLKSIAQNIETIIRYYPAAEPIASRIRSVYIELQDVSTDGEMLMSKLITDDKRQQELAEKVSVGYKLLKKHGVKDSIELAKVQELLNQKISKVTDMEEEIVKAEAETKNLYIQAVESAKQLSTGRLSVVESTETKMLELLEKVGMPNARLKIKIESTQLGSNGIDDVDFLFDGNKSGKFEPLRKVGSGGEFSRLLLCIKTLVAGSLDMPVLIFDEIDTGISGETARQVGMLMKDLGNTHQVISITHQPQIAAKADAHYYVYKKEVESGIRTHLRKLTIEERVETIAKMLSGDKLSVTALQNAKEMMEK
ncbi:MAG: DNA repair protein RecN [Chitinophagaceae bacterium]|nr:DNA repair protein RecN [Chitinophagaceae bacterium]